MSVLSGPQSLQSFHYGDDRISYAVRRVAERRMRVRIHVYPNGFVEVEAPEVADIQAVREVVRSRAQWIMARLREAAQRRAHVLPREYVSGESHLYLGRRYMLKVILLAESDQASKGQGVTLSAGNLVVYLKAPSLVCSDQEGNNALVSGSSIYVEAGGKALPAVRREKVKTLLHKWYREHAQAYFAKRLAFLSKSIPWLNVIPTCRLQIMRSQWGSCSPAGMLLLNPHLIKAPARCIDYVLLHEICHLREHNHSKAFYALLGSLCPDWEQTKIKLDNMADALFNE